MRTSRKLSVSYPSTEPLNHGSSFLLQIEYAGEQGVPFLATGGGNGYTNTTGAIRGGIGIDLGFFRDIHVNAIDNRLTIGGGVIFNDIFEPLHAAGKEIRE